jgi:hypothetical protein
MAYGGNSNNKINTNTRGFQFYNQGAGDDASTLIMGFWNSFFNVKIAPTLPSGDRTDSKVYDYDNALSILMGPTEVASLLKGISLMEASKKKDKSFTNTMIRVKDNIIKVGTGEEYENMGRYVAIFKVGEKGLKANDGFFYVFNEKNADTEVYFDYDEQTGKAAKKMVSVEWNLFKQMLEFALMGLSNAAAHGANIQTSYLQNSLQNKFDVLKGITENGLYGRNGNRNTQQSNTGGQQSRGNIDRKRRSGSAPPERSNRSKAPQEEDVDDISELEEEMNS